ncbi:MAG: chorismate-binding protein [Bacteroidales bacterium]
MRKVLSVPLEDEQRLRASLLQWGSLFDYFMLLDSNSEAGYGQLPASYLNYRFIAAAGIMYGSCFQHHVFSSMKRWVEAQPDWYFLHLTFGVKAETHGVPSQHADQLGFPAAFIFSPLWLVLVKKDVIELHYPPSKGEEEAHEVFQQLLRPAVINLQHSSSIRFRRPAFDEYQRAFESVQSHLARGDIYEMNYCINFYAEAAVIDPVSTYLRLSGHSPAPFSVFYRHGNLYLLSASPERFLKKEDSLVISQPIKGTIRRGKNSNEDEELRILLQNSEKDRSENIMITDLVRNDLAQFAEEGTVRVSDLCGVYTFRHVHQMISTIECRLRRGLSYIDAIRLAFPMGSMTGAPKRNALRFIEAYETFNRGLFSGAVGYITPDGNFDLNVVIRSILYDAVQHYVSIPAGSAITVYANALQEYEECCLKAQALMDVLT